MNCPPRAIRALSSPPTARAFTTPATTRRARCCIQHVLGTRPSRDALIFGREFRSEPLGPSDLFAPQITDDGHYMVIAIHRGVPAKRVDIVFRDLTKPGSPFEVLVWTLDARFDAICAHNTWFVKTDYGAPNGRIMAGDPGVMPEAWKTIVPEGPEVISDWNIVGGKLYVNRLKDVKTETTVYTLDGKPAGKIDYDEIGSASRAGGQDHGPLRVLHVPVVHPSADHVPRRYDDRQARRLLPAEGPV